MYHDRQRGYSPREIQEIAFQQQQQVSQFTIICEWLIAALRAWPSESTGKLLTLFVTRSSFFPTNFRRWSQFYGSNTT